MLEKKKSIKENDNKFRNKVENNDLDEYRNIRNERDKKYNRYEEKKNQIQYLIR